MPRRRDAVDAAARESPRLANEHDGIKSNAGNGESMVVTTESLLNDKKNIAADSYEKVLLPRVRSTTIRVTPSIAKGDLLKRAAQRTEVHYRKLPKHLDWKECLVNVRSAPLTLPDLRNAADGTNDLGCSCVGVVETVGPGTSLLKESDWVVPLSDTMGTFSSLRVWDEKDLLKIERDVMPVEYAALWRELALAYHLLETEASELKAGDAVLISAANGAVGQILIQLCRLVKLRTLCVVRKSDTFEDTKAWLEFLGAARVFCYEDVVADELCGAVPRADGRRDEPGRAAGARRGVEGQGPLPHDARAAPLRVGRRGLLRPVLRERRGRVVRDCARRAFGGRGGRPPRRVVDRGRGAGRRGQGVREAVAVIPAR